MGIFSRSWRLTKLSFGVIRQDTEMLLFPLLAGIFSIAYTAALLFPTILIQFVNGNAESVVLHALDYVLLFLSYLGLAFIATFFNVCTVFTTKTRFEGGDATFMDSIRFAVSRLHLIFAWSMIAATVGLLLRALDSLAERAGPLGAVILGILRMILGALWSLVTIFVVPAMVYDNVGPREAIKKSVQTLKETWGESLVRHLGLGLMQMLFLLLGVGLMVGLMVLLAPIGGPAVLVAIILSMVYFLAVIVVFNVANTVFNTALYAYAQDKAPPTGFDEDTLRSAFRTKS